MKKSLTLSVSGIIASLAASLCCIGPVVAILGGSLASNFTWLEALRPIFLGFTVLFLGFAWVDQIARSKKAVLACGNSCPQKPSILQGKSFLTAVTFFAFLALSFPSYSSYFYPSPADVTEEVLFNSQSVEFTVKGMTCSGCEPTVNHKAQQVNGVFQSKTSFDDSKAVIIFDPGKTSVEEILSSLKETGYQVDLKQSL
jgi:mercuric ion transport protein